jgi:hypothetical protein
MKFPALAAIVLFASSLMAQTQPQAQNITLTLSTFHSNSTFAGLFSFSNGSDVFLNVSRGNTNGTVETFLSFDSFSFNGNGFTDIFGFGEIPNDSLKGDNTRHISLNVDTSQLPNFNATSCTFSFITFTETCQTVPNSLVQVDWQQDGNFSTREVSDRDDTFFQFTRHAHTDSDSASAQANGSAFGIPISNGFGNTGINRDTTITLFKNH